MSRHEISIKEEDSIVKVIFETKSLKFNIISNFNSNFDNSIDNEMFFLLPKKYTKFWSENGKYVVVKTDKGYYLISPFHISYFIYNGDILNILCNEEGRLNIITKNSILRVINNSENIHLIEIYNLTDFDSEHSEDTTILIKKYQYRYIPFIIDIE
jgi:hypothetical protein